MKEKKIQFIIAFYAFYKLLTVNAESHLKTQLMAIMIPWNTTRYAFLNRNHQFDRAKCKSNSRNERQYKKQKNMPSFVIRFCG